MFVHPFYVTSSRGSDILLPPDENTREEYLDRFHFSNMFHNVDFLLASAIGGILLMMWFLLLIIAVFIIGSLVGLMYQMLFWAVIISFLLLPDIFDSWFNNEDIPAMGSSFAIRRRLISQTKSVPKQRGKLIVPLTFCRWKPRSSFGNKDL